MQYNPAGRKCAELLKKGTVRRDGSHYFLAAIIKNFNKMKSCFDGERPLYTLTIGEFMTILDQHRTDNADSNKEVHAESVSHGRLVYGLRGIQTLFNCSHKTAQRLKDDVIREAVSQNGRKIVTDVDAALRLFNERRSKDGK